MGRLTPLTRFLSRNGNDGEFLNWEWKLALGGVHDDIDSSGNPSLSPGSGSATLFRSG
jgi:hypothetical protein